MFCFFRENQREMRVQGTIVFLLVGLCGLSIGLEHDVDGEHNREYDHEAIIGKSKLSASN